MSGQSDLKKTTCPKCRNKNPAEAAFCGFCGADIRTRNVPEKATMFGYIADLKHGLAPGAPQAQPAPAAEPASPDKTLPADEAPTTAFTAGQGYVAGRYWLQSEAHKVPIGEQFQAKDSKSGADVALTLIDNGTFPSPLDMERTRRELRQLQKVNNKHLFRVLDHGKHEDGRLYVATELIAGSSLDQLVQQGPFDLASAKVMVKAIGAGLSAAQTVGIVHRDIAPHNVVVAADGTAKVWAIGAAPRLKDHLHGTPEYLSPEQASGRPVDQRSNIYSLGALMYFMMTGRPPFSGDTDQLLEQHKSAEPPPLAASGSALPGAERVQALLNKAMSKNSSRRHLTLRQFLREIEALSTDATPAPSPVEPRPAPVAQAPAASAGADASAASLAATMISSSGAPPAPESAPAPAAIAPTPSQPRQVVVTDGGASATIDDSAATLPGGAKSPAAPAGSPAPAMAATPIQSAPVQQPVQQPAPDPVPAASVPGAEPAPGPVGAADGDPMPAQRAPIGPTANTAGAHTVAGEMSGGARVRMRQTSEQPRVPAADSTPAAGDAAPAATPPASAGGGKGFRETMWFLKGEVESAMAEKGEAVSPVEQEPDHAELADKYKDDGTIDDEAARRLSLRTGKTQMMMKAPNIPSGHVPGDKMKAEEFIGEINQGRKVGLIVVALIAALVVALLVWLLAT